MKVVIAGGSGLIGRALAAHLASAGHEVVVLTRDSARRSTMAIRLVKWQPDGTAGPFASEIDGATAVVNLTGAGIADSSWTEERKQELRDSRVLPTRSLVAAIRQVAAKPVVFIQGSAMGFYGASLEDRELDESFPPGDDFLGQLCVAWEAEAHPVVALGTRLVLMRSGVVLSPEDGILGRLRLPFLFFVGGPVSSGRQYMSWIHLDDWVGMATWALTTPVASGIFNATSPSPVTNEKFSQAYARALGRPSWLRVPAIALRAIFGEMGVVMLTKGQRVIPRHALGSGVPVQVSGDCGGDGGGGGQEGLAYLPQCFPRAAVALLCDFRDDGEGDLRRRPTTEIESDGRVNRRDSSFRYPVFP